MNESAFLEAITSEPDELSHRLVFADWLEDKGNEPALARAAFIRAQIERSSLPAYHPRARELLRLEAAPFNAHGAAWYAAVLPLSSSHRFHRGFVEQVRVNAEQLVHNGDKLFAVAPVRHVQLRGTLGLPALLSRDPLNARRLADLLARVRKLDLNRDYLSEAAGVALLELPRPPRLSALSLSHNSLPPPVIAVLADSPVLESVEALEFTVAASAADALPTLLFSPRLSNLRSLSLGGARLGDRAPRLLAGSPLLGRLRSLCLSHNQISSAGLRALVESPQAAGLTSLDLSFNPIGADGVRLIDRSPYLKNLRELNLSRTELGDEGARVLAEGSLPGRLESLDLSLDHVGDRGAAALAGYARPERTEKARSSPEGTEKARAGSEGLLALDLIYNPLGARSMAALARRFGAEVCIFGR
jgi:uncharacterized protein (TIGR02996 family)